MKVFAEEVAPIAGWDDYTIGVIGHVTEKALIDAGAIVHVRPDTYTLKISSNNWRDERKNNLDNLNFRRNRRLRNSSALRSMVRETVLQKEDFIYPIFVVEGENVKNPVSSMPGVFQFSLDHLAEEIDEVVALGIPSVILFGVPIEKDATGTGAYA